MKDENLGNTIITLHGQGWSIRKTSREFGISRKRIHRLLVSNSVLRDTTQKDTTKEKKKRSGKLDPYKEFIVELLDKYNDITGQRVYEHLKEKGFDGEITIVRVYLKSISRVVSKTPVRMVETDPGQRAAHDWSDYNIAFTLSGKTEQLTSHPLAEKGRKERYVGVHQKLSLPGTEGSQRRVPADS
jgi:transposase